LGSFFCKIAVFGPKTAKIGFVLHKKVVLDSRYLPKITKYFTAESAEKKFIVLEGLVNFDLPMFTFYQT